MDGDTKSKFRNIKGQDEDIQSLRTKSVLNFFFSFYNFKSREPLYISISNIVIPSIYIWVICLNDVAYLVLSNLIITKI